jgi:RHS repeat-associated protein
VIFYYTIELGIDFSLVMNYFDTENPNALPYFYFLNGHNDVVFFADENFTEDQIETYEYNPWGILLTQANKNNLLYTSREFDFETGLQYNRNRYYNLNIGSFNYKDKILDLNRFTYSYNNPINYYDPLGLLPPWIGGLIASRLLVCGAAFAGCSAGCDYLKLTGSCTESE